MTKEELTLLWQNKFDHIYLQHYPKYKDRFAPIMNDLKRIGILDASNFTVYYSIPNNADSIIYNYYKDNNLLNPNHGNGIPENLFRQGYTHYRILNEVLMFDYKNILIIHDDVRFLNDLQLIWDIISNLPEDFDVCLFDYINCYSESYNYANDSIEDHCKKYNDYYYSYPCMLANTVCAYSKRYIDIIVKAFDYRFALPDSYISNIYDDYNILYELGIDINNYNIMFCNPRLAIQHQYSTSLVKELFNTDFSTYDQYQCHPISYLNKKIDYSMYNIYG